MTIYDIKELVDRAHIYYVVMKVRATSPEEYKELQKLNGMLFAEPTQQNIEALENWLEDKEDEEDRV